MTRLFSKLYFQLLLAILLGIIVGCIWPKFAEQLKPCADIFIRLIRVVLAPIIFGTVSVGIARMGNLKSVGRIGLKALVYFELVSGLALVIGLTVVNIVRPGVGMNVDLQSDVAIANAHPQTVSEFLLNLIPTSAVGPFVDGNVLQVILASVLFGICLSRVGPRKEQLMELLDTFVHVMFGIVRIIMHLAPIAAFGSMAFVVGKYGAGNLLPYARLLACLYVTCLLFIFCVLGLIARVSGISLWRFLRYIREEILIVMGTCSTESVLPQMMAKLEKLGCPNSLVGLVLPAGYTFNADGTSIYLTMAAIFIAQATGTHLTLADQLTVLGVLLLTSKGSAGVAGSGLVTLAATLATMNKIPASGLALVVGIESLLNEARAVTNVIGNGVATIAIAKWEGVLDTGKSNDALNAD
jgi:DAACS family dicarboxylate/amino acid:cation (Na+ or H+) symporter/aerobic C4-dicarboxylate transport protein